MEQQRRRVVLPPRRLRPSRPLVASEWFVFYVKRAARRHENVAT